MWREHNLKPQMIGFWQYPQTQQIAVVFAARDDR